MFLYNAFKANIDIDANDLQSTQAVVISIDVKKKGKEYEVFSHNGSKPTGLSPFKWAKKCEKMGAGEIPRNEFSEQLKNFLKDSQSVIPWKELAESSTLARLPQN